MLLSKITIFLLINTILISNIYSSTIRINKYECKYEIINGTIFVAKNRNIINAKTMAKRSCKRHISEKDIYHKCIYKGCKKVEE